jgi:large subunit ribosomal protein L21
MFAIVKIAGQQFKVAKDQKLFVHRLENKEGSKVSFENVLLLDNGKKVILGTPAITGASVLAKVVSHLKGDKVIVFKKKRRKGYRVKNGHRQFLTELLIENIVEKEISKKVVVKANVLKETVSKLDSSKKSAVKKVIVKKPNSKK